MVTFISNTVSHLIFPGNSRRGCLVRSDLYSTGCFARCSMSECRHGECVIINRDGYRDSVVSFATFAFKWLKPTNPDSHGGSMDQRKGEISKSNQRW